MSTSGSDRNEMRTLDAAASHRTTATPSALDREKYTADKVADVCSMGSSEWSGQTGWRDPFYSSDEKAESCACKT